MIEIRKILTLILLVTVSVASAQWSNTTNLFYDSLHMQVSTALSVQKNPLVVRSYPDSGYFIIWEDERNAATTKTDIYAQKYDKTGKRLWTLNGVPVANGPNAQRYAFSSNQDYRNRSFAATDSAGGFYIGYVDDSVTNYSWERIAIQHIKSNGTKVFGNTGYIVAATPSGQSYTFSAPFLIADGNKGCYISYSRNFYGENYIFVYSYRDEGGTMKSYGGGWVNQNAIQRSRLNLCGTQMYLDYPAISVTEYNIWPDGQGGCNVIMSMSGNAAGQGPMLGFNRIWRAKKNSKVKSYFRNTSGVACEKYTEYKKDQVYLLYYFDKNVIETICGSVGGDIYVVTSERLKSNGYLLLDNTGYDYGFPKGVTVSTSKNINVDVIAATKRTYANNTLSDFIVQGYTFKAEKYDSVPYQRGSFNDPDFGYNTYDTGTSLLSGFRDTLLAAGNYYTDFSLAGGGSDIYAAALMSTTGSRDVRLQHLRVEEKTPFNFSIEYKAGTKYGQAIGSEVSTGFSGSNISYDIPLVSVAKNGSALFYIREYGRPPRVSPIRDGAKLEWGAMGRPIGTGVHENSYYNFEQPNILIDPTGATAVMAWRDNRNIPGNTGDNIYMRHLDKLNEFLYYPPYRPVKLVPNPYGATIANPAVLTGSSKKYTTIDIFTGLTNPFTSPIADIFDEYNLGRVEVALYQNTGTIRKYNSMPYLNRNYTIKTANTPSSGSKIYLRLFFTTEEYDSLKAADPSIENPGDLLMIRQPNNTITTPNVYTPVGGEQLLTTVAWNNVPGGYYIEVLTSGFGNFFILKTSTALLCPGGSASFSSNVSSSSYQWQVNKGSGYTNVVNNSNYSGAKEKTLQLKNIPSSWYGYQYRCNASGNFSKVYTIKFLNTWTGAISTAWENPANWSCGVLPDANTDVVISSGTIVLNSNASCRSLTINPFVNFTVKPGFKLTVTH